MSTNINRQAYDNIRCHTPRRKEMVLGYVRKHHERQKQLIDLRVCGMCKYAFISRRGSNICSQCIWDRAPWFHTPVGPNQSARRKPSVRRTLIIMRREGFPYWLSMGSKKPAIPVPPSALQSPFFQLAIQDTLQKMKESYEQQAWIVHQMPKLEGVRPFPHLEFEGFARGRLGRKGKRLPMELQIERGFKDGA